MSRIFGIELTDSEARLCAAKEDLINYARELVGQKRVNLGPAVEPIPKAITEELKLLLERIDKYE